MGSHESSVQQERRAEWFDGLIISVHGRLFYCAIRRQAEFEQKHVWSLRF